MFFFSGRLRQVLLYFLSVFVLLVCVQYMGQEKATVQYIEDLHECSSIMNLLYYSQPSLQRQCLSLNKLTLN